MRIHDLSAVCERQRPENGVWLQGMHETGGLRSRSGGVPATTEGVLSSGFGSVVGVSIISVVSGGCEELIVRKATVAIVGMTIGGECDGSE